MKDKIIKFINNYVLERSIIQVIALFYGLTKYYNHKNYINMVLNPEKTFESIFWLTILMWIAIELSFRIISQKLASQNQKNDV